ncbi:MAG TPA: hypothetical protein ENH51_05295, partial [Euryarchaeota archaeon]|nr:hypothetical protein [Euryarchaeota archaeon]
MSATKYVIQATKRDLGLMHNDDFGEVSFHLVMHLKDKKYPQPFDCIFKDTQEILPKIVEPKVKGRLKYLVGKGILVAFENNRSVPHEKINGKKIGSD